MIRRVWLATGVVAALAVLLVLVGSVSAHGEGITVTPTKAAPGDKVTVKGEDWDGSPMVTLSLKGQPLGKVQADEDGSFTIEVTIPTSMSPGSYEITATNPEGEDSTAELQIVSAGAMAGADKAAPNEAMAGTEKTASGEESKNVEWRVNTATTPAERAGAAALIVVAALVGFGLILSARQSPRTA